MKVQGKHSASRMPSQACPVRTYLCTQLMRHEGWNKKGYGEHEEAAKSPFLERICNVRSEHPYSADGKRMSVQLIWISRGPTHMVCVTCIWFEGRVPNFKLVASKTGTEADSATPGLIHWLTCVVPWSHGQLSTICRYIWAAMHARSTLERTGPYISISHMPLGDSSWDDTR